MRSLLCILTCLAAFRAIADTPAGAVRHFLASAYEGRFDQLPVTSSVQMKTFERRVRNVLRVRCVTVDAVSTNVVSLANERASLDADVRIAKTEAQQTVFEELPLRFELARDGDRWLIASVTNRDDERAARLLRAKSEERECLLRETPPSRGLDRAMYALSLAALNAGNFKEAAEASSLARELAVAAADRGGEALALGAASYMSLKEDPGAPARLAMQALDLALTTGETDVIARAWYDRGRSLMRSDGRTPRATAAIIDSYRHAIEYAKRAEDPSILTRTLSSLANVTANALSDYLTARRYVDEGLAVATETGDEIGELGFEVVLTTIYEGQGDLDRASFHHRRAIELAEKLHAYAHPSLLIRSADLLLEDNRFDEAAAALGRIMTRDEKGPRTTFGSVAGNTLGTALRDLGIIEAAHGNLNEAQCLNREAAQFHNSGPGAFLFELAPYYARKGDAATALALALESLETTRLYSTQKATALYAAGRAYHRLGLLDSALDVALEAIDIRESIDARVAGDEQQRAYASNVTADFYELAADIEVSRNDALQALTFLERGRARVLTDIVEHGRPGAIKEQDAATEEQLAQLEREVVRISVELDSAVAPSERKRLEEQLSRARFARTSFADGMHARAERRHSSERTLDAATLLDFARRLPAHTVAIEYIASERQLTMFAISRDTNGTPRVSVHTTPIGRADVERRVNAFVDKLAANDLRVEAAGRDVYALLLQPLEREIASADALLVLPDDVLWRVPFAALVDGRGRFVVERASVLYAPSLHAFATMMNMPGRRDPNRLALLAVANPTSDATSVASVASFYRDATLGPLPETEREVESVRSLYDQSRSVVLERDRATEARTKAALRDASVAHFATHAILDDANPMYSRLMLAHDANAPEDGWLEGWEVSRLELDADLVILSACETARGKAGGGEGVVGLSWSFFLAGAHATVASQWKVASDTTAEFMIAFHRALHAPTTHPALRKAESLRAAQLEMLRHKRTRHPFHWAAFVLLGDPS